MKRLVLIAVLCMPVAAWAFVKPIRIVAPALMGLSCVNDTICSDDPARFREAAKLYNDAIEHIEAAVGPVDGRPRIAFCSAEACAERFGLGRRSALTLGILGTVMGAHAWKPFYVRHEMIHYVQSEKLGMPNVWRQPKWFREGMAYALSEDPRQSLTEPFESYRLKFERWYRHVGKARLCQTADKL